MKTIEILDLNGNVLFKYTSEENTIAKTLVEGIRYGADLRRADLRRANLRGADLYVANLYGADLCDYKIKTCNVFTGLYRYIVIPYITIDNEMRIKMGCLDRCLDEWNSNFWNNDNEFPNDGSLKSNERLLAFETAKKWLELASKSETQQ